MKRRDPFRPRRRDILAGSLALVAAPRGRAQAQPRPFSASVDVDIHCHSFCSADLPIVGFVAHYIPGLTDLSREIIRWPEAVVRAIVRLVAKLPNAVTPTGPAELATLKAALAGTEVIKPITPLPSSLLDDLINEAVRVIPFSVSPAIRQTLARYVDTLYMVAHARAALAATLADTYKSVTLFTPCLVDYNAWSEDAAPTTLADQILIQELIMKLSVRGRIQRADARFHPFVAFDPKREVETKLPPSVPIDAYQPYGDSRRFRAREPYACDKSPPPTIIGPGSGALEMVRYAIESAGFLGVKVYPPVGFAPLDNARLRPSQPLSPRIDLALRAFYAYCQAEEVPITTHASAGNEYGLGFRDLVAPDRWLPVLESYPRLRVNLGHFGHDHGVDRFVGADACEAWIRQASSLIETYPNVYADLSNTPLVHDAAYAVRWGSALRQMIDKFPKVKKRLMYGSDWWLNRLEEGAPDFVELVRAALVRNKFTSDEIADIMGRNALRFLGFLDDSNVVRTGRSAARLRKHYSGVTLPTWLG